ncbi:hypothetical protein NCCP28_25570 [Niallia sp. NCCP-28]|nr:hypothetical protein NCCP28_25570 [Niallia sp. NCCP-28]
MNNWNGDDNLYTYMSSFSFYFIISYWQKEVSKKANFVLTRKKNVFYNRTII